MGRLYFKTDFKEVYDKLSKMEKAMEKKSELMKEVGELAKNEIRALAPEKSGTLRRAIDCKLLNEDTIEVGVIHNYKTPYPNNRSTFIYGVQQEFGNHRHSSNSYMRVFYREGLHDIKEAILDRILSLLASA